MSGLSILLIVIAAIIAFMMAFFQYYYKVKVRNRYEKVLAILRFLTVFLVLVLLINPKTTMKQLENIKPQLNILVDNSSSIAYSDSQEKIKGLINEIKLNKALNTKFDLNYYAFSNQISLQDTFSFNKGETNILKSLQGIENINREFIAPIVLITDGNQTQGANYNFFKPKQPTYPIIVGDTLRYDDLKISQVNVNKYSFLDNKFPVEVFLVYEGGISVTKTLRVWKDNKVVFSKIIPFTKTENSSKVQFFLTADMVGNHTYTVVIENLTNEKNVINNEHHFNIEVIDEQATILILSAVNHPDIGMFKRSIETNNQRKVEIVTDLNTKLSLNDYQLVILYQPTTAFMSVMNELMASESNMLYVTGSEADWNFINQSQPYFRKNNINKTEEYTAVFNLDFDEFNIEDIGFNELPPLIDFFGTIIFSVPVKTILSQQIGNYSTEEPLLATFTDQGRRGAVLFGENSWKWRMFSKISNGSYKEFDTFFEQLIQYLSSTKRVSRLEINYQPVVFASGKMIITSQFFDANYNFDSDAMIELEIMNIDSKEVKILPFTLNNTIFEAIINDLTPGSYSLKVTVKNQNVTKTGSFKVLPYEIEQQIMTANVNDLKSIAEASGGSYFFLDNTQDLANTLLSDKRYTIVQKSIEKTVSLIDWKSLLAIALFLLSLEWFLRKYKGLI